MDNIIDINKDRARCEACECYVNNENIGGFDEDGNQFCNNCLESQKQNEYYI